MDNNAMMETLSKLKSLLVKELNKINEKGNLSETELKNAKCALEVVEKINHIERGEEPDEMYSQRGYYISPRNSMDGNSYNNSYNSYSRGRSARTGRYVSRDNGGYSGDQDYMIHCLEMAMNEAGSEQERRMISDLVNDMKNR